MEIGVTGGTPIPQEQDAFELGRLRVACGNDEGLFERVLPFAALVRKDTFGYPVVIAGGSVYVTQGSDRRDTGTHYTPRSLTEEIVKYTLQPLVYVGVAEGKAKEKWRLKGASALLSLKVCDMAMGSGAFLVEVCRYLSARLVEAWELAAAKLPGPHPSPLPGGEGTGGEGTGGDVRVLPDGSLSVGDMRERLLPAEPEERLIVARRLVADRCLYGVDKNPLAVEMAKLSLWLITLQKNKPFTFLDHALRCGDSLVGVSARQLWYWNMDTGEGTTPELLADGIRAQIDEVAEIRRGLERIAVETTADQVEKQTRLGLAQTRVTGLLESADLLLKSYFVSSKKSRQDDARQIMLQVHRGELDEPAEIGGVLTQNNVQPFHWELEFPEVFGEEGGFDAIVGNPPFQGGIVAATALGEHYMHHLRGVYQPWHGKADIVGLFVRKAARLVVSQSFIGILATASIIYGETLESSVKPLISMGTAIYRGKSPFPWPGQANVTAVCIWLSRGNWSGDKILDNLLVTDISSGLEASSSKETAPFSLEKYCLRGYLGIKISPSNFSFAKKDVVDLPTSITSLLKPTVGGEELYGLVVLDNANHSFDPSCLTTKSLSEISALTESEISIEQFKHSAPAKTLYSELSSSTMAFACAETTHVQLGFTQIPTSGIMLKHTAIGFPAETWGDFAFLQSSFYNVWTWRYGIRRKEDLRYSAKRCSRTYTFPQETTASVNSIGEAYYTHRQSIMQTHQQGLTKTYNRFHNLEDTAPDITQLRRLHIEMDTAVAAAYGWQDLALAHGFHETKQGLRFTLSEAARREVLDRLLALNHERYAEEVRLGLHDKRKKKGKKTKVRKVAAKEEIPPEDQINLFF